MLKSILVSLGLVKKPQTRKVQLPEGLIKLEVVSAKAWWS